MNTPRQRFLQLISLWTLMVFALSPLLAASSWCPLPTAICRTSVAHNLSADATLKTKPCCCKKDASRAMRACCNAQPKSPPIQAALFTARIDNRVLDSLQSAQNDAPSGLMTRQVNFSQPARRMLSSCTAAFSNNLQTLDHPPPSGRAPPVL